MYVNHHRERYLHKDYPADNQTRDLRIGSPLRYSLCNVNFISSMVAGQSIMIFFYDNYGIKIKIKFYLCIISVNQSTTRYSKVSIVIPADLHQGPYQCRPRDPAYMSKFL